MAYLSTSIINAECGRHFYMEVNLQTQSIDKIPINLNISYTKRAETVDSKRAKSSWTRCGLQTSLGRRSLVSPPAAKFNNQYKKKYVKNLIKKHLQGCRVWLILSHVSTNK